METNESYATMTKTETKYLEKFVKWTSGHGIHVEVFLHLDAC